MEREEMKIIDFLPTYEKRHIKHLAPSSQIAQWQILKKTVLPLFGEMELREINRSHAGELHDYVTDTLENSNRTSNEHLGVLSTILRCALEAMKIDVMPPLKRLKIGEREDHKYLTPDQTKLLLAAIPQGTLRDLVLVAVYTGLRIGELRMLKWTDFSEDFTTARIQRSLSGRCDDITKVKTTKSKFARTAFFSPIVRDAVLRQKRVSEFVFTDPDDLAHSRAFLTYKWCHDNGIVPAMKEANVWQPEFGFHTLRHTFACDHAASGTPSWKLKELMGHRHLATTERYVQMFTKDLAVAAANINGHFGS